MLFLDFTGKFKHFLCLIRNYINFQLPDFQPYPELFPFSLIRSLHIDLSVSRIQYVPSHLREFACDNFSVLLSPYGQILLCSFGKDSAQIPSSQSSDSLSHSSSLYPIMSPHLFILEYLSQPEIIFYIILLFSLHIFLTQT